jgi:hypothetical protein
VTGEGAPPGRSEPRVPGAGEHPRHPDPRGAYSSTLRIVRKLEKHPGAITGAAFGVYILGFIIVNIHYAQFRLLTFDLVRGQYVAAGLLFLLFTTAPLLTGIFTSLWIVHRARNPGPLARRARNGLAAGVLGLILCLAVDYMLAYLYDGIAVVPTTHGLNAALYYGLACSGFGALAMLPLIADRHQTSASSASARGSLPDGLRPLRRLIATFAEGAMHLLVFAVLASFFGGRVYPGITPGYGGGGAWIAEILTPASEGGVLPARWRGALVARDDAYLTVIPCPGALRPGQPRKPVEVRLDAVAGWTLLGRVNPEAFLKANAPAECR